MPKLLMITGLGSAESLASGKKGAFYNTLEEFHNYWERGDIICPRVKSARPRQAEGEAGEKLEVKSLFGNVFLHISPWPVIFHPFWFLKKGLEIYKEQKFDLMTVHEFPPFYNGIGARLLWHWIKVPYILEIFHIPGYPRSASFKESVYKFMFKLFIRFDASKAKAIRIMNNQVRDFLVRAGIPKGKIIYIPAIYIDLDIFKSMNLSKEYDLIFIGRNSKNKWIKIFKKAAKKFSHKIIGIDYWAKDSQEIAELLNKSRILVMPSYNEGGPRVVVEAMACGVPVLATPVGIVPDIIKSGESGE
ncbi:MAG: glycosyltransferase family 4 protein, partial [Patescibacteria group bacterium]